MFAFGGPAAEAKPLITTDRTIRLFGPVVLIGDSTSGGYVAGLRNELVKRGVGPFRTDIQGSRSIVRDSKKFPSGVSAVRSARASGFDSPAWVVALGGNDLWFVGRKAGLIDQMIDRILGEIGADRRVAFLNMYRRVGKSVYPMVNDALGAATTRWPNLRIADWKSVAMHHPEWHGKDGVHFTIKGAKARNAFLVATMIEISKPFPPPEPPPTTEPPPPGITEPPPTADPPPAPSPPTSPLYVS
jgi:hypothetical protein